MNNDSLSAVEVAEMLKITKNTVYEIVKRGELPGYKVGKKLRIDKSDVLDYINLQKGIKKVVQKDTEAFNNDMPNFNSDNSMLISGQDVLLDIISEKLNNSMEGIKLRKTNVGSYNSLIDLYNDRISICTSHLWDGDTDEYNVGFVRKLVPGVPCVIINLAYRMEGFYVKKGNPHNIASVNDLTKKNIKIINREKGSGVRILLDEKLRLKNILSKDIKGYDDIRNSHLSVAISIARGEGDVGIGTEKFAKQVDGIDFIPFQQERYDIVIKKENINNPVINKILEIIKSKEFVEEVESMGGYNLSDVGKIMATV